MTIEARIFDSHEERLRKVLELLMSWYGLAKLLDVPLQDATKLSKRHADYLFGRDVAEIDGISVTEGLQELCADVPFELLEALAVELGIAIETADQDRQSIEPQP